MAPANLELVRSIFGAWERGDFSSTEWAYPDIEFVLADGPDPGRWTGVAAMAGAWRDLTSAWEGLRAEADEYRELDDERVLVLLHHSSGRGKTSGVELRRVQEKGADVFHISGGKVTRLVIYLERDRALADLGLAPEAGARE
jgi:ketosteroid isomerase-like protein